MILLTSTADQLQVVTGAAATVDAHTTWVDTLGAAITPGRTNTNISTVSTTTVTASPAASTQRNVKTLHVRNRDAALTCDITVQHTDGSTLVRLYKTTLNPGSMLQMTDQGGFVQ